MQCPHCNHPIPEGSLLCMYCGLPAPESRADTHLRHEPAENAQPRDDALSLKKITAVIAKMKSLLDAGRFEPALYERMSIDLLRDYLSTKDDSGKLIFVSYEIQDSELAPYLTQDMVEKLKLYVMDAIAEK
ncbi:MAG: zinc ribbon domain-containing protein [Deltaproteobacteria bacterium]|nr:zinc ribbon domain-containing protein [Deltaproteobacteria bacterium]